jgi:phosphoribosylaminoimidazolecarboxamide formyltransferase/IMP cyclohydrolase
VNRVRRALVSVHDKTGLAEFAEGLQALGVEILSTGGTARRLRDAGVAVREVADLTGYPELLDGRVKTLHPAVHGGILARRDRPDDLAALDRHRIQLIDLVVVNLYPFERTAATPGASPAAVLEEIDVGGPALIRAAAKNHANVGIVTDPSQYAEILAELRATGGVLGPDTRHRLARAAFRRTAQYDAAIAAWLRDPDAAPFRPATAPDPLPARLLLEAERIQALRYGENPHQVAAFYRLAGEPRYGLGALRHLHGPELSYNNLLDLSAALGLLMEFEEPAAVVVKHTTPCGVGLGVSPAQALGRARAADPVSIYGGVVGVNRPLDGEAVRELAGIFVEILFAPDVEPAALEELRRTKQKARVLALDTGRPARPTAAIEYRSVLGGLLAQSADVTDVDADTLVVVSRRSPTDVERAALRFAWRVAKHVKSNAIVLATPVQLVGVGAGQTNRVDAARIAVSRARALGLDVRGAVCASDAFFPFRDGLDVVAEAGISAVIHPGGSRRDAEVVAAADEHGMAVVTTGVRHFRH